MFLIDVRFLSLTPFTYIRRHALLQGVGLNVPGRPRPSLSPTVMMNLGPMTYI